MGFDDFRSGHTFEKIHLTRHLRKGDKKFKLWKLEIVRIFNSLK